MRIKSGVFYCLAVASGGVGMLFGLGFEGRAQVGQPITDGQFIAAMVLILLAIFFMRLGFAAEARDEQEARRRNRIDRRHARPQEPEYRQNRRGA